MFPGRVIRYPSDIRMKSGRRTAVHDFIGTVPEGHPVGRIPRFSEIQARWQTAICPCIRTERWSTRSRNTGPKCRCGGISRPPRAEATRIFPWCAARRRMCLSGRARSRISGPNSTSNPAAGLDTVRFGRDLTAAVERLNERYPGLGLRNENGAWHVLIPDSFRVGHEAHFGQVAEAYLKYLKDGKLPSWEVPNMLAKYYTTTEALEMASEE